MLQKPIASFSGLLLALMVTFHPVSMVSNRNFQGNALNKVIKGSER